jgi:hypothetical protein
MPTLFLDRRKGELISSLATGRRRVTLAETLRATEGASSTVHLYVVDSDAEGRIAPVDLSASGDKPLLRMGAESVTLGAGTLSLTFGANTTDFASCPPKSMPAPV